MRDISELGKPFKYIGASEVGGAPHPSPPLQSSPPLCRPPCGCRRGAVSCVIMQDVGSGMHTAHSSFCDGINDGTTPAFL